jgi:hypothetical protein
MARQSQPDSVEESTWGQREQTNSSFTAKEVHTFVPIVSSARLDFTIHCVASRIEVFELQVDLNIGLNGVGNHQVCDLQLAARASAAYGLCVFLRFFVIIFTTNIPFHSDGSTTNIRVLSDG